LRKGILLFLAILLKGCVAEPEIKVNGVTSGDIYVYVKYVIIHIDGRLAGDQRAYEKGKDTPRRTTAGILYRPLLTVCGTSHYL
jgi:hypothetical protein